MKYSSSKKCASFKENKYNTTYTFYHSQISPISSTSKKIKEAYNLNYCYKHNEIIDLFCLTCVNDICSKCIKKHKFHYIIKNSEINKKEINILKTSIKQHMTKLNILLIDIKKWKNVLEKKINYLEKIIYSWNNIDLIDYENNENKIKNILFKFKRIYRLINSQENNEDTNINNKQYLFSQKGDFIKNGIEIIKYLSKISIDTNNNEYDLSYLNESRNFNKNLFYTNKIYRHNTYNGHLRINNDNGNYKDINYDNLETPNKHKINSTNNMDLKSKNNDEMNNSFNSCNSINSCNSLKSFNNSFFSNAKNVFSKKKFNNNKPQLKISKCKLNRSANFEIKSSFDVNDNNKYNSNIITTKINFKNGFSNNSVIQKINNINIDMNSNDNNSKYKKIKSNEMKYFTHKKFYPKINTNIDYNNIKTDNYYSQKINREKKINNSIIFPNKLLTYPIKSNLFINNHKIENNNSINNNSFKINDLLEEKDFSITIIKTKSEKKFKINCNKPLFIGFNLDNYNCKLSIIDQNTNDIQIISFQKDDYNIPSIIYFDENNEDIKIGHDAKLMENIHPKQIITNFIKLFGTSPDEIMEKKKLWPFQIYEDSNGRILIKINYCGKKDKNFYVENILILFFEQLFKKFFSKLIFEEDEVKDKNKNGLNILNINICITIPSYFSYIKSKILEKIFQKHIFRNMTINYSCNNDINILHTSNISIPSSKQSTASTINFFNYNNNKNKNNKIFDIILNNIKIEYSPNPAILCLQNNNIDESISSAFSFKSCSKENNILIINITGDSTNISISSINNEKIINNSKDKYFKKYQVKYIINLDFGEEDFINNYFFSSLLKIDKNIFNNIINSPNELSRIKNIFVKNINLFDKNPLIEITIYKFFYNYDLKIILNKQEYINCSFNLFNNIILSIKNILSQSKLSEMNIDDLLLIGQTSKCNHMKQLLCELFKNNKLIYNKLKESNFENDDFYLVTGASLEAMNNNLNTNLKKYIFKEICPISFGIENAQGEVDLIIKKGNRIPIIQKNLVKIYKNKNSDLVEIKICEIDNENKNKKLILSSNTIDIKNMKLIPNDYLENEFVELLFEFEIDDNFNLSVFILDRNTFKRRFEFSINIDVVKNK